MGKVVGRLGNNQLSSRRHGGWQAGANAEEGQLPP